MSQDDLRRENERLRGDLRTVAYRLNHDLRTPLGGIVVAGEMIKEVLAENSPASEALIQPLFTSADDMSRLLERVSFVIKASLNETPRSRIEMSEIVAATLTRLESRILKKKASVLQPPDWPQVEGVRTWLETVWWNLIANAAQHGGESPQIQLGWDRVVQGYRFWVRDHGPGLPNEKRSTVFKPFHLLHETGSGSGLGLPIVHRLIEMQGGHCGYESPQNGGSCFCFTLPAQ